MEADWEFEVGSGAPVIDVHWQGFVDLTANPQLVFSLPEAGQFPALAEALIKLNAEQSPVWTSKCDFWKVDPDEVALDADEINARSDEMAFAGACYVDLLARIQERWRNAEDTARDCGALCSVLHDISLRCCRADLVIRRAVLAAGEDVFGITAYLTACGTTEAAACEVLGSAIAAFADSIFSVWMS
jgi:hypothetical protein